jgi:hypothetical protein
VPGQQQRGQGIGADVHEVMTTSASRMRQAVR